MEIILSKQCLSLTGSFGKGFGYSIQKQHGKFVSKRNSKGEVPANGHLRFILTCAELAQMKLHISDIRVTRRELVDALWSAGYETAGDYVFTEPDKFPEIFSASDIINYRRDYLPSSAYSGLNLPIL